MGRQYGNGKGIAASAIPYKRTPPTWLKTTADQVNLHICQLAKRGLTPSQIGVILRDSHGIGQVKTVTGNKIFRILKANGTERIFNFSLPDFYLFSCVTFILVFSFLVVCK
jgi:small subunit ribosomal protein S13e